MKPPTVATKLTRAQKNKAKSDAFFKMNVDLTKNLREGMMEVETDQLEATLNAYLSLMNPPEDSGETVEVQTEVLQQMSLFACKTLTHILTERYRGKL